MGFWFLWFKLQKARRIDVIGTGTGLIGIKVRRASWDGRRERMQRDGGRFHAIAVIPSDSMNLMNDGEVSDRGLGDPDTLRERMEINPHADSDISGINAVCIVGFKPALDLLSRIGWDSWVMDHMLDQGLFSFTKGKASGHWFGHLDTFNLPGGPLWHRAGRADTNVMLEEICWSISIDASFVEVAEIKGNIMIEIRTREFPSKISPIRAQEMSSIDHIVLLEDFLRELLFRV